MRNIFLACVFTLVFVLAAALPAAAQEPAPYLLYPGDLVHVSVFDNTDLESIVRIPTSGRLSFPLIGEVDGLLGLAADELGRVIEARLRDGFLRNPVATVTIKEFGPRWVTVVGNVHQPGTIALDPLSGLTAMQAIGRAGGFLEDADRPATQVVRRTIPTENGEAPAPLLMPAATNPTAGQDVQLQPGDLIVVPRLNRIFVLGQVKVPRAFPLPNDEPLTVSKAISLAGGFEVFAKQNEVQLIRVGSPVTVVKVREILTGVSTTDPVLQAGDTVFVPESRL